MTSDEIIARVCAFLDTQGCKSEDPGRGFGCLYRGRNNTKCAVGCLIPDELYDPKMEDHRVRDVMTKWEEVERYLGRFNRMLLTALQTCHDRVWIPEEETFTQAWERFIND